MSLHLLLTDDFPPMGGGIARWMGELAKRYPPGTLVTSTGTRPGGQEVDAALPNRVDRLGISSPRLRTVQGLLLWSRRAIQLAQQLRPSFIWCGRLKPPAYVAKWVLERIGTPYGVILHGTELLLLQHRMRHSAVKRHAARVLLGSASVLVVNSRWTGDLCCSVLRGLGLNPERMFVRTIHPGTDPEIFRPGIDTAAVRERYGLNGARWLLTVARLVSHKGIDTVIRAMADLSGESDLHYAVVGSGNRKGELEKLARELGVSHRVRFLDQVPDTDLPALYNVADIYVGASRTVELMAEGFGIALTEASACGVPVIGARSGGIPDAVREGETGLLVDPDAPRELARTIRRLLRDPELARRLGAAGRQAVETYFNWDRVTTEVRETGAEVERSRDRKRRAEYSVH